MYSPLLLQDPLCLLVHGSVSGPVQPALSKVAQQPFEAKHCKAQSSLLEGLCL
jgi:hypothetical protein